MYFDNTGINNTAIEEEMLFFVPLCTHEEPLELLLIGDSTVPQEAHRLAKNIKAVRDISDTKSVASETFDIVVFSGENANKQELYRVLKKDGILCAKLGTEHEKELRELGNFYRMVMPYHSMKLVFASNKYHPTADIILDRADFLENNEYYNADIQLASFALHERAKRQLKGIVKA